jgi:asparagine synthase (glutamine-hydrolysing)
MQPMRIHALPHIWMIYNGEIYNFKATQKKYGYQFETSCDGEILIHLYNDKGACFMCEQLYGVFAFVLFDTRDRKVYVGRDTYGVRPSFRIYTDCGFLAVSSEVKGLKGITVVSKKSLNVEPVEPGTYEEYKLDENERAEFIQKQRFHTIGTMPKYDVNVIPTDDVSSNIRAYLTNAVKMRLMSHRRIGCMLSGGLDSSLIAALTLQEARKQGLIYPIQTFSIGMDDQSPDLIAARKVAKHLGTEHHEIRFTLCDVIGELKNIIKALESYDITTIRASIGMYFVSQYIQKQTDTVVILSGEGADEVCQGYIYFYRQPSPEEGDSESRRLCKDLYLFDVLRADRTTAAHGLELRVPFLDHAFTAYYLSLPAADRAPTKERMEKYLLRKAFDQYDLIPSEILWRPKEAFSDGVSTKAKSLYVHMQEYAETQVTDDDLKQAASLFPMNTPKTKEAFLYRSIFEELYPKQAHLTPYIWLPKWCGDQQDPSARVLKHYKEQQGDSIKS